MVRAAWDGLKTNTRRLLYAERHAKGGIIPASATFNLRYPHPRLDMSRHPVGTYWTMTGWQKVRVGDRLWVRETFQYDVAEMPPVDASGNPTTAEAFCYAATSDVEMKPWVSPIHMPRRASRLTLVVTATKIERLQDISEADAKAEGIYWDHSRDPMASGPLAARYGTPALDKPHARRGFSDPRQAFGELWKSLHGPGAWDENPWVVALSFVVHKINIDSLGKV
jgi:hypothetical protein